MFSRISGTLLERDGDVVRLEAGGLTYDVVLAPSVAAKVDAAPGTPVALEVYAQLQIDGNAGRYVFFGFTNTVEREFFEALISVAGVGPKAAARAFSAPMGRIARAIDDGDHVFLKTLPGIGQQKARDIVAKLQGKVGRFLLIQDAPARPEPPAMPDFAAEALAVLLQLAYRRPEAEQMITDTLAAAPHIRDAEALLAEIYRQRKHEASSNR
ncbi:MAG: Holliday junction branch migration protein RuvA [Candidatus Lustribacter sp.]|jgi:Holliday junction DNA helicase RuvA